MQPERPPQQHEIDHHTTHRLASCV
jgi:hypothetical protein